MSEAFDLTTEPRLGGRAVVVRVRGRLDARTAPRLLDRCAGAQVPGGRLVLNLGGVSFLSSAGVGALMVLAERARVAGGSLHLAPVSAPVCAVLELLNLDQFLRLESSEDEALRAEGA